MAKGRINNGQKAEAKRQTEVDHVNAQEVSPRKHPSQRFAAALYGGLLLGSLYLLLSLSKDVADEQLGGKRDEDLRFDDSALDELEAEQSAPLVSLARALSTVGSDTVILPLSLPVVLALWRVDKRVAKFFSVSVGGAFGLQALLKRILRRKRPEQFADLASHHGYSFPSGHTAVSSAFVLALFLSSRQAFPRYRWLVAATGFPLTLGIGAARPYLQIHHPSDVLASYALSILWVLGIDLWYEER